jgi:hypothetical protein
MSVVLAVGNSISDMPLFNSAPVNIIVDNPTLITDTNSFYISSHNVEISQIIDFIEKEVLNGS